MNNSPKIALNGQINTEGACFIEQLPPDVLTGVSTLEFFANLGARFALAVGKAGRKPTDDTGRPIDGNYLDLPQPLNVAAAHLQNRNNTVGFLPEYSNNLSVLDIDAGKDSWVTANPDYADAAHVYRDNAPDRLKFVILITDLAGKYQRQDAPPPNPSRKAELLGIRNHACIAGRHTTGSVYKLRTGRILVRTMAEVIAEINAWIPNPFRSEGESTQGEPRPSVLEPRPALSFGSLFHDAIAWWNDAHLSEVEALFNACEGAGQFRAIRKERTPSTRRTDTKQNPFYKATWRDYGAKETYDAFELYCILKDLNKAAHKWVVVNEWRASQGLDPIPLR